jgi:hypothetical protein
MLEMPLPRAVRRAGSGCLPSTGGNSTCCSAPFGMPVLGPPGGLTASYVNFSLGFFVGGQVLAGILGSIALGGGMLAGLAAGLGTAKIAWLGAAGLSMSTVGRGWLWVRASRCRPWSAA